MLEVKNLQLSYEDDIVVKNVSFSIEKGTITTLIGPNGCGKSTIFKALTKLKKPDLGSVTLRKKDIKEMTTKDISKQIAFLPQSPIVPNDFTVRDLVGYGRYPHLGWTGRLSKKDQEISEWAISETKLESLQHRHVSTLSGGERQRAWIAMALAQQPKILLLDEPTTFLDIGHQFELLELIHRLNAFLDITVLMVLHDLNHAARYSDKIIALKNGIKFKEGTPREVVSKEVLEGVFDVEVRVFNDSSYNCPYCIPVNSKNKETYPITNKRFKCS